MKIIAENRNGNLHVQLKEDITEETILQLLPILCKKYRGEGNIFLNTEQCSTVAQKAPALLESEIRASTLPTEKVYIIGKLGFTLSTGFAKVIVRPARKARCLGCRKGAHSPQTPFPSPA